MSSESSSLIYSIAFIASGDGDQQFAGYALGINALLSDQRDAVSQYVMAHKGDDGSAGRWLLQVNEGLYTISFVSSAHGGDLQFKGWSLGVNALPKDKRDAMSQYVMAHSDVSGCDGKWAIEALADGTHAISFIRSAHGGDKQFAGWGLGIKALPMDTRDSGSQFVMAHGNHDCAGRWMLVPVEHDNGECEGQLQRSRPDSRTFDGQH